jgi:glycosyltransferase involved in cell wall biosynthesis
MITFVDATTSEHARGIGTVIEGVTTEWSGNPRVVIAWGPSARPDLDAAVRKVRVARTRPGRLLYQRVGLPLDVARMRRRGWPIERILLLDAYIPLSLVRRASRAGYAVLVHDALPLTHPHFWPPAKRLVKRAAFLSLRRARPLVFTSSEHNADEIERLLEIEARVVHFGCGQLSDAEADTARRYPLAKRDPYFVTVGAFDPRKNLALLVDSFEQLARLEVEFSLHLVGGSPHVGAGSGAYEALLRERIARSTAANRIVVHRDLDRAETIGLVRHATALALPSLAEGFGLPIIEALALGTPIVAGDLPEIRSWAGDAIHYASPHRPSEWVDPLLASVNASEERRRAGQEFASAYRWKACAAALLEW